MKVIYIYMLHDSLDTVASASLYSGLGLTENFWPQPRPHTFWPRPQCHPSLASLTSLHIYVVYSLNASIHCTVYIFKLYCAVLIW